MNKVSVLLLCLAFAFAPSAARASVTESAPITVPRNTPQALPFPAPINNLSGDYQKREAANPLLESFQGGGTAIYLGGGAVTVLLIVLLVVLVIR